jgi:hypothetical protein
MLLSDAIMLGSTQTTLDSNSWDQCLIGVGLHAFGITSNFCNEEGEKRWPWILKHFQTPKLGKLFGASTGSAKGTISVLAEDVQLGLITLEQAVDWIRSHDELFDVCGWPTKFADAYEKARSQKARAKIAADRIEHFIATKGAE